MAANVTLPGCNYQLDRLIWIKVMGAAMSGLRPSAGGTDLDKGCSGRVAACVSLSRLRLPAGETHLDKGCGGRVAACVALPGLRLPAGGTSLSRR
jgi:hypothetical protein